MARHSVSDMEFWRVSEVSISHGLIVDWEFDAYAKTLGFWTFENLEGGPESEKIEG